MSKRTKLLVLEDEELSLELLAEGLEDFYGYEVRRAKDVESAKAVLEDFYPDLLLFDVVLGDDRFRVIRLVHELREEARFRDIPVLFVTAYDQEMGDHVQELQQADLLAKPFVLEQVVRKIRGLLKA